MKGLLIGMLLLQCALLQGFTSTSVSPCVAKSFATCCVHLQLWTTHLAEKQMSSCVTHSLQKIRQSYYHLWNKCVWSFFSFLLKLMEYLCFASCTCIGTDHRFKCGLRSVLGHIWARPSFPLWPERTGKQSHLVCLRVIHLLLDHPHVLWAKFVHSHLSFHTPHRTGALSYCMPMVPCSKVGTMSASIFTWRAVSTGKALSEKQNSWQN